MKVYWTECKWKQMIKFCGNQLNQVLKGKCVSLNVYIRKWNSNQWLQLPPQATKIIASEIQNKQMKGKRWNQCNRKINWENQWN